MVNMVENIWNLYFSWFLLEVSKGILDSAMGLGMLKVPFYHLITWRNRRFTAKFQSITCEVRWTSPTKKINEETFELVDYGDDILDFWSFSSPIPLAHWWIQQTSEKHCSIHLQYPLVMNVEHSYWQWHIYSEFSDWTWWFSIAVCQSLPYKWPKCR